MDLLSLSSTSSASHFPSLYKPNSSRSKPLPLSFKPISSSKTPKLSAKTLALQQQHQPHVHLSTAPQNPSTAMRGAESDAMGLLLRERIVFLGNSIDDFVADAIISQLLLLDAQDPKKDIRLFINSPGGSLRYYCYQFIVLFSLDAITYCWDLAGAMLSYTVSCKMKICAVNMKCSQTS